jgi:DNA-binding response OmpR family regulator
MRILIVEDDDVLLSVLAEKMEASGYEGVQTHFGTVHTPSTAKRQRNRPIQNLTTRGLPKLTTSRPVTYTFVPFFGGRLAV